MMSVVVTISNKESKQIMGRTIPSFRIALSHEEKRWKDFRSKLPKQDKKIFDDMFSFTKLYISSGMMSHKPIVIEPLLMSIIFHHYKQLSQILQKRGENLQN